MKTMQTDAPLVSVIIPFFNIENFIKDTIESVLAQEYKNWEIILIDDGSTDKSTAIVKDFASKYPAQIFYMEHDRHTNKAAAASRNLGLTRARGELIAFLDADDIWLPNKLKEQVAIFQKYPEVKLVCEASKYWYSWENTDVKDVVTHVGFAQDKIYYPPKLVTELYPLGKGSAPCPSGAMVAKSVFKTVIGFEESFVGKDAPFEDLAFFNKIYLHERVYVSSSCNNLYRQRSNSVAGEMKGFGYYASAKNFYLQWLKKYLKTHQINNNNLRFLLWKTILANKHPFLSRIINKIDRVFHA